MAFLKGLLMYTGQLKARFWPVVGIVSSLALGSIIIYGLSEIAGWVLGFLVGVDLVILGVNMLYWSYDKPAVR